MTDASRNVDPAEVREGLIKAGLAEVDSADVVVLLDLWLSPEHRGDLLALLVPRDSESFEKMVEAGATRLAQSVGLSRTTYHALATDILSAALAELTEGHE